MKTNTLSLVLVVAFTLTETGSPLTLHLRSQANLWTKKAGDINARIAVVCIENYRLFTITRDTCFQVHSSILF